MSTTPISITKELPGPKCASDLINATGMDVNEGVQVSIFPGPVDNYELGPSWAHSHNISACGVYITAEGWGRRLLDIITEPVSGVKWWKVRYHATTNGLDLVPVSWAGAAQDIPEKFFQEEHVGLRLFGEGPWFWPHHPKALDIKPTPEETLNTNLKVLEGFSLGEQGG